MNTQPSVPAIETIIADYGMLSSDCVSVDGPKQAVEQTMHLPTIWNVVCCNDLFW